MLTHDAYPKQAVHIMGSRLATKPARLETNNQQAACHQVPGGPRGHRDKELDQKAVEACQGLASLIRLNGCACQMTLALGTAEIDERAEISLLTHRTPRVVVYVGGGNYGARMRHAGCA